MVKENIHRIMQVAENLDTSNLTEIYVAGRPRSGTVWLTRLLSDALASPIEIKGPNAEPPAFHGPNQDGEYVIRKTHGKEKLGKTVFIQRDPRDVAVSTMHYRGQTQLFPVIKQMCSLEAHKTYESHARLWLDDEKKAESYTRYEWLHKYTRIYLRDVIFDLTGRSLSRNLLDDAIERQSFKAVKSADIEGRYEHSMWKGKVGEWENYFTKEIGEYLQKHMGDFMIEQGYVKNKDWWHKL